MSGQDCKQLTLFQEDSRASRSVWPGSDEARRTTVTSGRKCLELSRSSGPLGSLVRMLLESSQWRSTRCYLTWKVSATPTKRLLFRLVPSTPRTGGTDVQSWPTPTAADSYTGNLKSTQQKPGSMHSVNLSDAVRMWPTATARDYKCANSTAHLTRAGGKNHTGQLANAVKLWPTATGRCGKGASQTVTRQGGPDLQTEVGGQLNPTWVEWLMGFPIGWTDLDA